MASPAGVDWGFRPFRIPEQNYVQFLRESDRSWQSVTWVKTSEGSCPLLVAGWIVRFFRGLGRPPVYGLVNDERIETIPAISIDAMLSERELPRLDLSLLADADHLYLDISGTWFPSGLYGVLSELSPRHETLRFTDEVAFWQFRKADWSRVESALSNYKIHATLLDQASWAQRRRFSESVLRPIQLVSRILEEAYSGYLKREGSVTHLRNDLALSHSQPLPWAELQPLWTELREQSKTDRVSRGAVDFVLDFLATDFNWKRESEVGFPTDLSGLVLSVEIARFGRAFAANYFRLYIPMFASVLHLQTTVNPTGSPGTKADPSSIFLKRMWLERWRVLPYLGIIKNTGDSSTIGLDLVAQDYSDTARHLASLPTMEAALCELARFQSFDMDRNGWNAGYYPFSRTFLAAFEVRATLDKFSAIPAIFVRDVLGTPFQLEFEYHDYDRRRRFLRGLRSGQWIALLATNRLEHEVTRKPTRFRLGVLPFYKIAPIDPDEAEAISAFGLVKVLHDVGRSSISALSAGWGDGVSLVNALDRLRAEDRLFVREDSTYVYVPDSVSGQAVAKFEALRLGERSEELGRFKQTSQYRRLASIWRLREKAHPLVEPRVVLTQELLDSGALSANPPSREFMKLEHERVAAESAKLRRRFQDRPSAPKELTLTRKSDARTIGRLACWQLEQNGEVILRAAGGALEPAYDALDRLEHEVAYLSPRTETSAEWVKNPQDRPVRAVKLRVSVPGLT